MKRRWRLNLRPSSVVVESRPCDRRILALRWICSLGVLGVFASFATGDGDLSLASLGRMDSPPLLLAAGAESSEASAADHDSHAPTLHGRPYEQPFGDKTEFLWWSPQLFGWTLALFLILWFILGRLVWGPMMRGVEDRDRRIQESLAMAEKLRDEAKSIAETMDEEVVQAQQAARATLDQARAEAAQEVADMMAKAREEQAAIVKKARSDIESALQHGKADIEKTARRLGEGIAEKLMGSPNGGIQ